jgi:hypothetical protein
LNFGCEHSTKARTLREEKLEIVSVSVDIWTTSTCSCFVDDVQIFPSNNHSEFSGCETSEIDRVLIGKDRLRSFYDKFASTREYTKMLLCRMQPRQSISNNQKSLSSILSVAFCEIIEA